MRAHLPRGATTHGKERCITSIKICNFTRLNHLTLLIQFSAKAGEKATIAKDKALDKTCGSLLQKICQKYDNLDEVDKLASVTKKVDTVKLVMQENVDLALQNCVKLETIERAAGEMRCHSSLSRRHRHTHLLIES